MAVSKVYLDYAVKLHAMTAQSAAALYIDGVRGLSLNPGLRTVVEAGDGEVYGSFGSLVAGAPVARISSVDVKAVLDAVGLAGMLVDSDGTHPGVELYQRRMAQGGTRASGSVHHKTTIANGLAVVRRISAQHQEAATVDVEVYARKDGSTAPLAFDEAAALPSHNAGPDAIWTVGPVDLNGTDIEGIESVDIDLGVDVLSEGKDSDVYPTFCSIRAIRPTIRLRTRHVDLTTTLTEDGAYYAASQVIVYLRKRAEGGTFVADGTAEHISLTLGKCRVEVVGVEGDPKAIDVLITPWATIGSVDPIALDTTAAIA
jgi:hypothetical protein